ncbi:MAG: HAD hydrolase family protein [Victivallaceae bacterium]|nr:HAD hydrolase family protein [Victivallaceae bacterium]
MNSISQDRIDKIRAIVLDIDGVMTDGRLGYSAADEIKFFNVLDGHGIKLALRAGLLVGVLSGRKCIANRKRAEELGLSFFYEGAKDKKAAFEQLQQEHNLRGEECLCIGDDIVDIPLLKGAGIGVTVADALDYMDNYCDFRTVRCGGRGAVREVLDWLLQRQGKWDKLMERYLL